MASTMTQPRRHTTTPSRHRHGQAPRPVDQRIERLSTASLKRIVEPDTEVPGDVGDGQVLPDELLTLANLPELFDTLTDEQKRTLAREEFASIVDTGVRFESVLMAGFSIDILSRPDLTDPRVTYLLHEMGEETRHSRLFVRLLEQVKPDGQEPPRQPGRPHRACKRVHAVPHRHAVAVLPARPQRRRGPRPPAEAGQRAPRHRPDDQGGLEVPPPGGGPPPRLRPHALPRAVGGRRPDRALPGAPPRLPHRHRHVRHDRAPGRLRHRRPPHLGDLEGRQPLRRPHRHAPPGPAPAAHPAARSGRLPRRPCPQGLADRLRRRPRRSRLDPAAAA